MSLGPTPRREPPPTPDAAAPVGDIEVAGLAHYSVHEEDPDEFWEEAVQAYAQTRPGPVNLERFAWLYRNNPDGPAVLWSIRDTVSRRIAGFRAALPRRVLVDGEQKIAWNGGDFSVYPAFRSLGVALKLDRVIKDGVDGGRVDFFYSFPTERMQIIHDRAGFHRIGNVVRLVRPLRSRYYLRRRRLTRWVPSLATRAADGVLSWRSAVRRHRFTHRVQPLGPTGFDERFDALFQAAAAQRRVIGVRDRRYLGWRYAQNPLHPTHGVVAEDGGALKGYALFRSDGEIGSLKDVLAVDGVALRDVVVGLVRGCRDQGLSGLEASVDESHPVLPVLQELGFLRRPNTEAVYAYAPHRSPIRTALLAGENWLLALGDRDV